MVVTPSGFKSASKVIITSVDTGLGGVTTGVTTGVTAGGVTAGGVATGGVVTGGVVTGGVAAGGGTVVGVTAEEDLGRGVLSSLLEQELTIMYKNKITKKLSKDFIIIIF
jgi:hypothetical protein